MGSQDLLPLFAFRRLLGPTDDVRVPRWVVIALDSKTGLPHCRLRELPPTMEFPCGRMFLHDLIAQIADLITDETIDVENGKLKRPVRLEQLGLYARVGETAALHREPGEQTRSPDGHSV